jgi:hypothetical protein
MAKKKLPEYKAPELPKQESFKVSLIGEEVKHFEMILDTISRNAGLEMKGATQSVILSVYNFFLHGKTDKPESHFDVLENRRQILTNCFEWAVANMLKHEAWPLALQMYQYFKSEK